MAESQRPRPVLFVDHATHVAGAERVLLDLLGNLDRRRWAPHLATQQGQLAQAARALAVTVHELELPRLRHRLAVWHLARGARQLRRLIGAAQIELLHVNTVRAGFYAYAATPRGKLPLLWHVHDILSSRWYVRLFCRRAQRVVAVSAAAAAPLHGALTLRIVHNGVDLQRFGPASPDAGLQLRREWGIPAPAKVVAQIARLQPWKGQRDFLAAAELLLRRRHDVYFVIVGSDLFDDDAAYVGELRARVARLAAAFERRVILAGWRDDIPEVLSATDVLIAASATEPFGMVLIEAAAAAVPVVAYDSGAAPEIVQHDKTGMLVRLGDVTALAASIEAVLDNEQLARRLGLAARHHATARFDVRQHTESMQALYTELLESGPARREGRGLPSRPRHQRYK